MLNSSETNISTKSQPCINFERGHCYRGQHCRFLHIQHFDNIDTQPHNEGIKSKSALCARQPNLAKSSTINTSSNTPICRHFITKGWCGFGNNCRFSHCSSDDQRVEEGSSADTGVELQSAEDGAGADDGTAIGQYNDEVNRSRRVLVCKFYQAGYCRHGRRCHFQHVRNKVQQGQTTLKHNNDSGVNNAMNANLDQVPSGPRPADENSSRHSQHPEVKIETIKPAVNRKTMRETEIMQFRRRYPKAVEVNSDTAAVFKFLFEPTDPDWVNHSLHVL